MPSVHQPCLQACTSQEGLLGSLRFPVTGENSKPRDSRKSLQHTRLMGTARLHPFKANPLHKSGGPLTHIHFFGFKRTDSNTGKYGNWGEMSYFLENTCLLAEWPRCTLGSSTSIFHDNCFLKSPLHQTLARAWQPLSSVYLTGTLQLTCVFPPKLNEILPLNHQDSGSSLGSQGR